MGSRHSVEMQTHLLSHELFNEERSVMSNSNHHANEVHAPSIQGVATRRDFLQGSLAVAGTALASSIAPSALSAQAKAKRPNLVFFLGEGQRADALSIAGNPILN